MNIWKWVAEHERSWKLFTPDNCTSQHQTANHLQEDSYILPSEVACLRLATRRVANCPNQKATQGVALAIPEKGRQMDRVFTGLADTRGHC